MKRFFGFLAVVLVVVSLVGFGPDPAHAQDGQETSYLQRPVLSLHTGAMVRDGLAPYVEMQAQANVGVTPFGLALHGGFFYETSRVVSVVDCFVGPCPQPDPSEESYLGLVTGLRFGFFPQNGPVDVFFGVAPHFVRHAPGANAWSNTRPETHWTLYPTVEGGIRTRLSLTDRLGVGVGVLGFLPVQVGASVNKPAPGHGTMSRLGAHLSVQYEL